MSNYEPRTWHLRVEILDYGTRTVPRKSSPNDDPRGHNNNVVVVLGGRVRHLEIGLVIYGPVRGRSALTASCDEVRCRRDPSLHAKTLPCPPLALAPCCGVHDSAHHHRMHLRHAHRGAALRTSAHPRLHPLRVESFAWSTALTPNCCCVVHMPRRCLDAAVPCACRRAATAPTARPDPL